MHCVYVLLERFTANKSYRENFLRFFTDLIPDQRYMHAILRAISFPGFITCKTGIQIRDLFFTAQPIDSNSRSDNNALDNSSD